MKRKVKVSECEYQGRLKILLKDAFNADVQPLRSLETVTKKRRALKKRAAKNSAVTKSDTAAPLIAEDAAEFEKEKRLSYPP